jgi:hypothetical protein
MSLGRPSHPTRVRSRVLNAAPEVSAPAARADTRRHLPAAPEDREADFRGETLAESRGPFCKRPGYGRVSKKRMNIPINRTSLTTSLSGGFANAIL